MKLKTAIQAARVTEPGFHAAGPNLYLRVGGEGSRSWICRVVIRGKRRDVGLGSASLVTLAEARAKAHEIRKAARAGEDPLQARRARAGIPTFAEAARRVHEEHTPSWRNPKHAAQWINTLEAYAFPHIGERRVCDVVEADVLAVLSPIWIEKAETARRVKQRVRAVLDFAKAQGWRNGENPVSGISKALPKQSDRPEHYDAVPYAKLPAFVRALRDDAETSEAVRLAVEFTILTAARAGEVVHAKPEEFDLSAGAWTVPASRMKAKRPHRVPLSERAVEIVTRARAIWPAAAVVFPGGRGGPLTIDGLRHAVQRLAPGATTHGMRSAFRDWCSECTSYPHAVAEAALAHVIKDKAEAAYARSDLLERRRALMTEWAAFIEQPPARVVSIRRGRRAK